MADTNQQRRKRFADWQAFESEQQKRELDDLSFYDGPGQWPEDIAASRGGQVASGGMPAVPARPMITVNKIREPIRHIINEERDSELGVEIVAADDFGVSQQPIEKAELEVREGIVRRIQRESHAIDARIWAAERATIAGRGYYGVMSRYLPGKTNDQELFVRRFYDQGAILLDPAHEEPDGSDAEGAFVPTWMPWEEYKATYPKRAKGKKNHAIALGEQDFKTLAAQRTDWFSTQNDYWRVRVVEHWYYERTARGLATLTDGRVEWEDTIPTEARDLIQDVREVLDKSVQFCLLDGFDEDDTPLDETDWEGKYIPIIKVVGEEIQPFDAQRRFEGVVRPSRESQQGFNYMISKWVEMIGLTPVPPLMMTPQHVEGYDDMYNSMATRNWPVLYYNATDPVTGQQLPSPTRPPVTTDIAAIAGSVQMFDQAIKSTSAVPDATLGNVDPSVRSGKGIQALALNALKATAHFGDNFQRSVNYEGRILNDLLYPIYGRRPGRKVRTYSKGRQNETVTIGPPQMPQGQMIGPNGVPPQASATLTPDANFNITIKVTKNYDTLREQEASTVMEAVSNAPEFWLPLAADLLFKYQDGPGHDELSDRGMLGLRPDVRASIQAKQNGQPQPDPQTQQLLQENQQLKQMIASKTPELQTKMQIAQMQEAGEAAQAQLKSQTDLTKTEIMASASMANAQAKVDAENFRSYVDALEQKISKSLDLHMQAITNQLQQVHEHQQQAHAQAHEAGMAAVEHAQALQQGAQAAQQQSDLATQQAGHTLDSQAQQAALQPEPTAQE